MAKKVILTVWIFLFGLIWQAEAREMTESEFRAHYAPYVAKIVNSVYIAEGGPKAKVPYGVLSVKVASKAEARNVCRRTVWHQLRRWSRAGSPGEFLDFLGDVYCPIKADRRGNFNWKRNMKFLVYEN